MSKIVQITLPQIEWKKLFGFRALLIGIGLVAIALGYYWWNEVRPFFVLERGVLKVKVVQMHADAAIRLDQKLVEEGARFQKGDLLVSLKDTESQMEMSRTRLQKERGRLEETMERYVRVQAEAPMEVDRVLLEIQAVQQKIDQEEQALVELESHFKGSVTSSFRAPFAGVVRKRLKEPGDEVLAGEPVLLLCDFQSRWVEVHIPEEILGKVHVGTSARIEFLSFPDKIWEGQVSWISSFVEEGKVLVRLLAPALPEQAGLSANVSLRIR